MGLEAVGRGGPLTWSTVRGADDADHVNEMSSPIRLRHVGTGLYMCTNAPPSEPTSPVLSSLGRGRGRRRDSQSGGLAAQAPPLAKPGDAATTTAVLPRAGGGGGGGDGGMHNRMGGGGDFTVVSASVAHGGGHLGDSTLFQFESTQVETAATIAWSSTVRLRAAGSGSVVRAVGGGGGGGDGGMHNRMGGGGGGGGGGEEGSAPAAAAAARAVARVPIALQPAAAAHDQDAFVLQAVDRAETYALLTALSVGGWLRALMHALSSLCCVSSGAGFRPEAAGVLREACDAVESLARFLRGGDFSEPGGGGGEKGGGGGGDGGGVDALRQRVAREQGIIGVIVELLASGVETAVAGARALDDGGGQAEAARIAMRLARHCYGFVALSFEDNPRNAFYVARWLQARALADMHFRMWSCAYASARADVCAAHVPRGGGGRGCRAGVDGAAALEPRDPGAHLGGRHRRVHDEGGGDEARAVFEPPWCVRACPPCRPGGAESGDLARALARCAGALCRVGETAVERNQDQIVARMLAPENSPQILVLLDDRGEGGGGVWARFVDVADGQWLPMGGFVAAASASVFDYVCEVLALLAQLCAGRNYNAINAVSAMYPFKTLLRLLDTPSLPPVLRARCADLLLSLHVDRDPMTALQLPSFARVWDNPARGIARAPEAVVAQFTGLRACLVGHATAVAAAASSAASAAEPASVALTVSVLRLGGALLRFGAFPGAADVRAFVRPMLRLLAFKGSADAATGGGGPAAAAGSDDAGGARDGVVGRVAAGRGSPTRRATAAAAGEADLDERGPLSDQRQCKILMCDIMLWLCNLRVDYRLTCVSAAAAAAAARVAGRAAIRVCGGTTRARSSWRSSGNSRRQRSRRQSAAPQRALAGSRASTWRLRSSRRSGRCRYGARARARKSGHSRARARPRDSRVASCGCRRSPCGRCPWRLQRPPRTTWNATTP